MDYRLVETTFVGLKAFLASQTGTESLKVFEREGMKFFCIFHATTKVGCVTLWRTTTTWRIKNLFVAPNERQTGLGTAVVFRLFDIVQMIDHDSRIGITALSKSAQRFWGGLLETEPTKHFALSVEDAVRLPKRQMAVDAFPSLWD